MAKADAFLTRKMGSSAPSSLDFGVEPLPFDPGVFDAELPVDAALLGIRFVRPRCDLELKVDQFTDAAVAQALARQATQLALGDIQPTSVLRCVAESDPFDIGSRSVWFKRFIECSLGVRVEVVANEGH